jgi:DegV family protein with EDD domain
MFDDQGQYERIAAQARDDGRAGAVNAPTLNYLDGRRLARGLRAGIARVLADKDTLNRINVFPVADGDTGTNIAATLGTVLVRLDDSEPHAGKVLAGVADAALDGARGNSGAILAQFFQGVYDKAAAFDRLTAQDYAAAVRQGARYAREALSSPREGTILTVIADYAKALAQQPARRTETDLRTMLQRGLAASRRSLANTPKQLEVLRRSGVVDAGAKGFVDLLEGIDEYLRRGSLREQADPEALIAAEEFVDTGETFEHSTFRYCTECLISGEDIDRRRLREQISALGDSVVIAGTRHKVKVHVHTDHPEQVFELAGRLGGVTGEKADDMHAQTDNAHHRARQKVAVLMDSAGDVPEALMERFNINVVPLRVQFGDVHFLDKVTLTPSELFERMRNDEAHPSTSQPSPADLRRQYDFLASHYEGVLSIHITSRVSGTWQAATAAAQRAARPDAIHVMDTGSASLGQGLIAVYAAECADAGFDLDTTRALCEAIALQTKAYAYVRDLRYAVRGGRVPKGVKAVADFLRLTPVLGNTPDGRIAARGVLFGRDGLPAKLSRFVRRRHAPGHRYRLFIGHGSAPEDGAALRRELAHVYPEADMHETEIGTALGVHGGPGIVVVGIQAYEPPRALAARLGLHPPP